MSSYTALLSDLRDGQVPDDPDCPSSMARQLINDYLSELLPEQVAMLDRQLTDRDHRHVVQACAENERFDVLDHAANEGWLREKQHPETFETLTETLLVPSIKKTRDDIAIDRQLTGRQHQTVRRVVGAVEQFGEVDNSKALSRLVVCQSDDDLVSSLITSILPNTSTEGLRKALSRAFGAKNTQVVRALSEASDWPEEGPSLNEIVREAGEHRVNHSSEDENTIVEHLFRAQDWMQDTLDSSELAEFLNEARTGHMNMAETMYVQAVLRVLSEHDINPEGQLREAVRSMREASLGEEGKSWSKGFEENETCGQLASAVLMDASELSHDAAHDLMKEGRTELVGHWLRTTDRTIRSYEFKRLIKQSTHTGALSRLAFEHGNPTPKQVNSAFEQYLQEALTRDEPDMEAFYRFAEREDLTADGNEIMETIFNRLPYDSTAAQAGEVLVDAVLNTQPPFNPGDAGMFETIADGLRESSFLLAGERLERFARYLVQPRRERNPEPEQVEVLRRAHPSLARAVKRNLPKRARQAYEHMIETEQ